VKREDLEEVLLRQGAAGERVVSPGFYFISGQAVRIGERARPLGRDGPDRDVRST
jgi:hypothetical protein